MFEDLEGHPSLRSLRKISADRLNEIRGKLGTSCADFVEFKDKFGYGTVSSYYSIHESLEDAVVFFTQTLELEAPNISAWIFGDNSAGDYAGIHKTTGKVVEIDITNLEVIFTEKSFSEFIREKID